MFLNDDDEQKVLVRATSRVVDSDQCGVPLERRFAFYDQVHIQLVTMLLIVFRRFIQQAWT